MPENKIRLAKIFDPCILQTNEEKKTVYSSKKVLEVLFQESLKSIEKGELDLYGEDYTKEQSAEIYALEMFEYNYDYPNEHYLFIYDYE